MGVLGLGLVSAGASPRVHLCKLGVPNFVATPPPSDADRSAPEGTHAIDLWGDTAIDYPVYGRSFYFAEPIVAIQTATPTFLVASVRLGDHESKFFRRGHELLAFVGHREVPLGWIDDAGVVSFSLPREFFHQPQLPPDAIGRICVETDRYSGAVFHRRIQRQLTLPWRNDR